LCWVVSAELVADAVQLVAIDAEMPSINPFSSSTGGDSLQQQDAASRAWLVFSRENAVGGTLWTKSIWGKWPTMLWLGSATVWFVWDGLWRRVSTLSSSIREKIPNRSRSDFSN
jgi:hypothetical protein